MTAPVRVPNFVEARVDLAGRAYDIVIGRNQIATLSDRIATLRPGARVAIVTDDEVARVHLATVEGILADAGITFSKVIVPAGESSKSYGVFERVCEELIGARIERSDLIVALGGGVIGDLAGFAASALRRGMDFVQVPTTLLAQVDSSVGGKTGINSHHGKNLVGAFHQPILVIADTALLDTLPLRIMRAGYAEVAKYGLISDPEFFGWLEVNWRDVFAGAPARGNALPPRDYAVLKSVQMKAAIVARDERETGDRALLNLGHTFGHALEAFAGFSDRLYHGEAVSIGMVLAFDFSVRRGLCKPADAERMRRHLSAVGLPTRIADIPGDRPDAERLIELIGQDKKVRRGRLTFILARGIGESFIAPDIDVADVRAFLADQTR
jgi:3-dehydroquinate synthase